MGIIWNTIRPRLFKAVEMIGLVSFLVGGYLGMAWLVLSWRGPLTDYEYDPPDAQYIIYDPSKPASPPQGTELLEPSDFENADKATCIILDVNDRTYYSAGEWKPVKLRSPPEAK